jgi:hypothetical protein
MDATILVFLVWIGIGVVFAGLAWLAKKIEK